MLDRALELLPQINEFLRQGAAERAPLAETLGRLISLRFSVYGLTMNFRFALEAALRIRRIREDQQRNLLLAANIECDRLRSQLAAVDEEQARRNAMAAQQIAAGIRGAELQFDGECRKQAKILQDRISLQLLEAAQARPAASTRSIFGCAGNAAPSRHCATAPGNNSSASSAEENSRCSMRITCCSTDERNRACLTTRQHLPGRRGAAARISSAGLGFDLNSVVSADGFVPYQVW